MHGYFLAVVLAVGVFGLLIFLRVVAASFAQLRADGVSSWSARHSVAVFFLYLILMLAAGVLAVETAHALNIAILSGRFLVIQFAFVYGLSIAAIAAVFFVAARGGSPLDALGFRAAPLALSLKRGLTLFFLYLPLQLFVPFLVSLIWKSLTGAEPQMQEPIEIIETASPALLTVIAVAACVLAPFFEEVIFRAFIQRGFETTFGPRTAVVATALLFAAVHAGSAVKIAIVPLALVLSLAYQRSRDITANIAFHALFNAASLVIAVLSRP